jgi:hypothetical protein
MLLARHQNAVQNRDIRIASRSLQTVAQFRYLRKLNSGNAWYHSIQNPLFSCLFENVKMRMQKTTTLPVALHGCDIQRGTQTESFCELGAEENIWREEG